MLLGRHLVTFGEPSRQMAPAAVPKTVGGNPWEFDPLALRSWKVSGRPRSAVGSGVQRASVAAVGVRHRPHLRRSHSLVVERTLNPGERGFESHPEYQLLPPAVRRMGQP